MSPRRDPIATAAVALLALGLGWVLSDVPLRFDDFNYLTRALARPDDPLAWTDEAWFVHWRPLAYLAWWFLGPLSLAGTAVRALLVVLWAGTLVVLARGAWRRQGAHGLALVILGLPLCLWFLEVLDWRSWITTAGTALGLALGLLELSRPPPREPRWAAILVAGLLALGFKETGPFVLGWAALLVGRGRARATGVVLVALSLAAAWVAKGRLEPALVALNGWQYLEQLSLASWLVPLAVVDLWGERRWRWGVAGGVAVFLLGPWGAPAVLAAIAVLCRRDWRWGLALAAGWAVILLGEERGKVYLLEGWLVLLVLRTRVRALRVPWAVWACCALLALPPVVHWVGRRGAHRAQAAEQRAFLETFDPEPAEVIFVGPLGRAVDLDALVWLSRGAELAGFPPPGTRPVQVGPRSCIWADVVPLEPGEPEPLPPGAGCRAGTGF